jgi:hypothetical protein
MAAVEGWSWELGAGAGRGAGSWGFVGNKPHRSEIGSAASRPIPLRTETLRELTVASYGGSHSTRRLRGDLLRAGYSTPRGFRFPHRWMALWPRSAQDDILPDSDLVPTEHQASSQTRDGVGLFWGLKHQKGKPGYSSPIRFRWWSFGFVVPGSGSGLRARSFNFAVLTHAASTTGRGAWRTEAVSRRKILA